jgi:hypothetical protein
MESFQVRYSLLSAAPAAQNMHGKNSSLSHQCHNEYECLHFLTSFHVHTSPLRTLTNASMREKPSKPREFAMISILLLHLCRASSLHKAKRYNNVKA